MLTPDQTRRYARHLRLPQVGPRGQEQLLHASVLIVGAGGLGSPAALYLAAAGVGRLGLVDFDHVDETNLQRQILYGTKDVGRLKLEAAEERLRSLNPDTDIVRHDARLTSENAMNIVGAYDVVLDGTDNFATRYLVNDAAILTGTPNVYASIYRFDGQVSVFGMPDGPCYRCIFPDPPPPGTVPSCAEGGVLGVLPGILGCMQAAEAIKLIVGVGEPLVGRMITLDVETMRVRTLEAARDPECPVCGDNPQITELIDYDAFCGISPDLNQSAGVSSNEPSSGPPPPTRETMFNFRRVPTISVRELATRRENDQDHLLLDVRMPSELEIADIGGTLIPLQELPDRIDELRGNEDREIVVMCRSGGRSAQAVQFLRAQGFKQAVNLDGGILAWSAEIDDTVPTY